MTQGRRVAGMGREYLDLRTRRLVASEHPSAPGKKNTRRWCKGHVGVEHQLSGWRPVRPYHRPEVHQAIRVCLVCGKHVETLWFSSVHAHGLRWRDYPDWNDWKRALAEALVARCRAILAEKA